MAAQSFTNLAGNPGSNQPTSYVASDGFVGAPVSGFNPNSPTFNAATFPSGATLATATITTATINGGTINNTVIGGTTPAAGTFTAVTGTSLVLKGATSGTMTVSAAATEGTQTLTLPAVSGVAAITPNTALYEPDVYLCTGATTANNTTVMATVTGLTATLVIGTYRFRCYLPSTVANGTGGIAYSFNYASSLALSALECTGTGYTASAVAVQHTTTTTTGTALFTQAAVVIQTILEGVMVVSTGGTLNVQMAQNTANSSNSVTLLNSYLELVRIA